MLTRNQTLTKYAREISPFVGGYVCMTFSKDFSKLEKVEADFENARECLAFCEYATGKFWFDRIRPLHINIVYVNETVFDSVNGNFDRLDNVPVDRNFRGVIRRLMMSFVEEVNKNLPLWNKWYQEKESAIMAERAALAARVATLAVALVDDEWDLDKISF